MSKNVLVTGAAGFLGSHLAAYHLKNGDNVWGVDNFCSSRVDSLHIKSLLKEQRFTFWRHDVTDDAFVAAAKKKRFDIIYNMACPASPPIYQRIPIETMMTCVVGTKNVLDIAHSRGATVVHASTSEVYGDPTVTPQSESYRGYVNSYGPRSCYDEGKRAAEALCYDYRHQHDVDARIARIFNTYGPHMMPDDGRVVSNFIVQGIKQKPLTVYGNGSQTRSFTYVDDLVSGLVALGSDAGSHVKSPVNIGNPNEFSIYELAKIIKDEFNVDLFYRELPTDDPKQRKPDISKAMLELNWTPKVQLDEGLRRTIEYFRMIYCK